MTSTQTAIPAGQDLVTTGYRAHVFDFDGTIAETGDLNLRALCAGFAAAGAGVDVEWLRREPLTTIEAIRQRLRLRPPCRWP